MPVGLASDSRRAVVFTVTAVCGFKMPGAEFAYDLVKLHGNEVAFREVEVDLHNEGSWFCRVALGLHIAKEIFVAGVLVHAVGRRAMTVAIIVLFT